MERGAFMTDPISDMLSRIRNAILVGRSEISLPHSILKERVAKILAQSGFLATVKTNNSDGSKELLITINEETQPSLITEITRVSRPGRRQYVKAKDIPKVKAGRGVVVLSTSQGVMSGTDAKSRGLGGELICEVY